jgi:hypothetical protein
MQPLTTVRPRMAMAHLCQAPWPIGRRPAATCSVGVQGEPRGGAQRALGLPGTIRSPRLLWLHHLSIPHCLLHLGVDWLQLCVGLQ